MVQAELIIKWGAHDVRGLDQNRAVAIGLEPAIRKIGPATGTQNGNQPHHLEHPGTLARFLRRTAELMLQNSKRWKEIEVNTRETNAHYKELLTMSRVQEEAYRTAADILYKIVQRPGLLSVWENSCPGLLRSKKRELEIQIEGASRFAPARAPHCPPIHPLLSHSRVYAARPVGLASGLASDPAPHHSRPTATRPAPHTEQGRMRTGSL
jgi:hypothetical protein